MKIVMLGSLGNINKLVIPELLKMNHQVTVVTSNPDRVKNIKALGATAAVGTISDINFLTKTFAGNDIAYLMVPSTSSNGTDLNAEMKKQGTIFYSALLNSGVQNVIQLSSIGAESGPDAGSLYAYHYLETELNRLTNINLAFIRPVGFYNNLYSHLDSIKNERQIYSNVPDSIEQKYVAHEDIAEVAIKLILKTPAKKTIHYVTSDSFSLKEFITKLSVAANLPDLQFIQICDDQLKQGLLANHVPDPIVDALLKTSQFQKSNPDIYKDLTPENTTYGQVKLIDFIKQYAVALVGIDNSHHSSTIADK